MPIPSASIQSLQGFFDKIFIVTVPRFTDRHKKVSEQLQGLSFDFFWGADKLQISPEKVKQDGTYDEVRAKKLQRQGKELNPGEIACALSHRMVYQEMIKHDWKKVLILEDDVLALTESMNVLPLALQELPVEWELVYLGYLKHENVTAGLKAKQFFYKILSAVGLMKWNYKMVVTGEKNGKMQYTLKKSKAYFNYNLIGDDNNEGNNKTIRFIFIACSLLGFVFLLLLFLKRKKSTITS